MDIMNFNFIQNRSFTKRIKLFFWTKILNRD